MQVGWAGAHLITTLILISVQVIEFVITACRTYFAFRNLPLVFTNRSAIRKKRLFLNQHLIGREATETKVSAPL